MKKIIMEALYGEYSNLYGDRGNLLYVQEKLRRAGVEFELIRTHLFDRPAFAERAVDLLYIGPCTESQQEQELAHLRPYADALRQRMEGDGVTLATGNAFELFGEAIVCEDGRRIQGLGFWPTTAQAIFQSPVQRAVPGQLRRAQNSWAQEPALPQLWGNGQPVPDHVDRARG